MNKNLPVKKSIDSFKTVVYSDSVQEQFKNALKENASLFIASLIDLYTNDKSLQECNPKDVIMECLKAATLKLPINKTLGYAWIVPYHEKGTKKPRCQIGYKGYIQLAIRTGLYKNINADVVYEGEQVVSDRLSGAMLFEGSPTSGKAKGYFAFIETVNGFQKSLYWSKEKVEAHKEKYSKSFNSPYSTWKTDYDKMAMKTVLKTLLSQYGIMSIEMSNAMESDDNDMSFKQIEADRIENTEVIDTDPVKAKKTPHVTVGRTAEAEKKPGKVEEKPAETENEIPDTPDF